MRLMYEVMFFSADNGDMSHLPAWLRLSLAVDMHKYIIHLQDLIQSLIVSFTFMTFGTQQVDDGARKDGVCITQGIAQDDTPEHIELRAVIPFDGMVPAV